MATVAQVREAIADACETITGLRASAFVPDQISPGSALAVVARASIEYDLTFGRGRDVWNYTVVVYAARSDERSAQAFIDTLCEPSGAGSLKTVLETDAALAALVDYAHVKRASELTVVTIGAVDYLACSFDVEVCY